MITQQTMGFSPTGWPNCFERELTERLARFRAAADRFCRESQHVLPLVALPPSEVIVASVRGELPSAASNLTHRLHVPEIG